MRNRMFLAIVLSLCMADFGAFAAPRGRTNNTTPQQNAAPQQSAQPVAARAGARQKVVGNTGAQMTSAAPTNGGVAARAGKKQTVVNTGAKTSAPAGTAVAARAGATQKVIQTGTKVATAAENTAVSKECQDSFFGCMDAFCMLDNATGGRCLCSDRIDELNQVLDDILKLDQQAYVMATEGVERIQMGEAEEQILARAKAAAAKTVTEEQTKKKEEEKKNRTLDLSIFNKNIFNEDDEDLFGGEDDMQTKIDDFANKKGNELYVASAKMCAPQMPAECKNSVSMLQMVYAQRIKSDCMAYENSLKAQKNQSQQKLQTAQKALRDAALDEYKNQNKYATTGECAIAFAQCMQTTAECKSDYTGCVTLAAAENVKNNKAGSKAKQTTIKGAVAGADITLAASTLNQLLAKKEMCEHIVKQCVNSNKNDAVWNVFLRNAAPALKSAELIAEQNLRSNCIPTAVDCFKKACKSQFGEGESFDMCLSNPETYKSLCKVELEPCLEATGGSFAKPTQSSLWNGLVAALKALKVDACTTEVKACLTERCGEDYSGCIGLDTNSIGNLCPNDKLTACMDKYDPNSVKEYVAEIAQGLALQIDNALATACENAANEAMIKVCGDTASCDALVKDDSVGSRSLKYEICQASENKEDGSITYSNCKNSLDEISQADTDATWAFRLSGVIYWNNIDYDDNGKFTTADDYIAALGEMSEDDKSAIRERVFGMEIGALEKAIDNAMRAVEADPKVTYCMTGRKVQGFGTDENDNVAKFGKDGADNARFPNLLNQTRQIMTAYALKAARDNYMKKYDEETGRMMQDQVKLAERIDHASAVATAESTCASWAKNSTVPSTKPAINVGRWIGAGLSFMVGPVFATAVISSAILKTINESKAQNSNKEWKSTVDEWNYKATINTMFNESTGVCTKETIERSCTKKHWLKRNTCKNWSDPKTSTQTMQLL